MLPFPFIVQARGLSKAWRARFSPVSSLNNSEVAQQRDAVTFQRQVRERATNWTTFFPVCMDDDFFCGYDRASEKWVRFPSLSFLPKAFRSASTYHWIEGPLLYGIDRENDTLYVANVLTRSWRRGLGLPPVAPPAAGYAPISVRDAASETYKVIYLQGDDDFLHKWSAQIYEPKSDVWTTKKLFQGGEPLVRRPAYLNGVLYMASYNRLDSLLAYNMAEETLEELELAFDGVIDGAIINVYLVSCDGKLHMVVTERNGLPVRVLAVDLESRRLLEVARAPDALSRGRGTRIDKTMEPVSDANYIFFSTATVYRTIGRMPGLMVAYDVHKDDWSLVDFRSKMSPAFKCKSNSSIKSYRNFEWIKCSFQQGVNPFAEV